MLHQIYNIRKHPGKGLLVIYPSLGTLMRSIFSIVSLWLSALEQYSRDTGSSPGGDTCFSHQEKLLPVGGCPCKWLQ